jgi:Uma2 family endonuclease
MSTVTQPLTLEEFLKLPETKPASEFINGEIVQKPMPQGEHSLLQGELCEAINRVAKPQKIAIAFPELRCTFGGDAVVPDVAVFRWERIPLRPSGRIVNRFEIHPDWSIEILSPDQSQTKVLGKLLHCSQHGTELGWLGKALICSRSSTFAKSSGLISSRSRTICRRDLPVSRDSLATAAALR